jgi:hypothetical protein
MIIVEKSQVFTLTGAHFQLFLTKVTSLISKKHALGVCHLTVTLKMMNNNRRSFSFISVVLVRFISCVMLQYLLNDFRNCFAAIATVLPACLIYRN